jgi:pilus assembly protein CpaE
VPISINKGTPITLDSPAHPVSHAIARFAQQRILPAAEATGVAPEPASRRGRRSA